MEKNILTVGTLLDKGLIKKSTKVKLNAINLRELKFIQPLSKTKVKALTSKQLLKKGLIKRGRN